MASVMGDVSLDTGFAEALIIYGDRTIKGVGGGVCQVSTTLFRNAFFSGFPIIERHPHAYRVSYYEYTAGMTRDPQLAAVVFCELAADIRAGLVDDLPKRAEKVIEEESVVVRLPPRIPR